MNRGTLLIAFLSVVLAVWFAFGHHLVQQTAAKAPTTQTLHVPLPVPPMAPLNGLAWQITHVYDIVNEAGRLIPQIADLGADTVMISAARYQENAGSPTVYNDPQKMPSSDEWRQIIKIAHDRNLRVILMPIILLAEPRGTEWRGEIQPPNWDAWFASYEEYILDMARLAQANHVEVMTVGSELVSTEKFDDRWKKLIHSVRTVYDGKLSYSANWDHYRNIEYWKDLDYIGMTTYHKLADEAGASLDELIDAWKPIKTRILEWQRTINKPILFTEVGWCSQEGAAVEAWNYYHHQVATAAGLEEQRRLYLAFMETWGNAPQVGGVIWWEWTESPGGPEDYNYTPRGKPAEKELRHWFAEQRKRARSRYASAAPQSAPTEAKRTAE